MVKINITIEDLEITSEQLLALLGEDAEMTMVTKEETPACPDCGKRFKSQSSVNSHLKHCRTATVVEVKPTKAKKAKKAKKEKPKRACTQCGTTTTAAWRKVKTENGPWCNKCAQQEIRDNKKPKKPSYPGLTDAEVLNAVVSVLVSRTKEITTAHLIADQIVKIAASKYADNKKLTKLKETILDRVTQGIKQVGKALGMTECMVVDVNVDGRNGAQIAMFPAKEYSVKELLKLTSN
jgi:hypothetical protein